jgi:hypothetical protein
MICNSIYKVPGGKLIKIKLKYSQKNKVIENIKITGDFFAYPEDSIEKIESNLINTPIIEDIIFKKISYMIKENRFLLIGFNAENLTKGIIMCLK